MARRQRIESRLETLRTLLDIIAKLSIPLGVIIAALIANSFQSRISGTSLLSEREQAESELRATMFSNLIGPIAGPHKETGISLDREILLIELLGLNFHEHFELKPLFLNVDSKLSAETSNGMTKEEADLERESLRSIARRITDRQIAGVIRSNEKNQNDCNVFALTVQEKANQGGKGDNKDSEEQTESPCHMQSRFWQAAGFSSPDGVWTLNLTIKEPDWQNQTMKVSLSASPSETANEQIYEDINYDFTLTWFDFPMTDNTLLPDGNRFALVLGAVSETERSAVLRLIWFPKDYFTPRERPLNHRDFLDLLGKKTADAGTGQEALEGARLQWIARATHPSGGFSYYRAPT